MERFADVLGHLHHLPGHGTRDTFDPFDKLVERHFACLIQRDPPEQRCTCRFGKSRPVATRTIGDLEELADPLHTLLVLDLGQRILHGIGGAEVGEIHLSCRTCLLIHVQQVSLFGGSVKYDLLLPFRQFPEWNICANPHVPGHVLHETPHKCLPRQDGTFIDRFRIIGDQRGLVHLVDCTRPSAFAACT